MAGIIPNKQAESRLQDKSKGRRKKSNEKHLRWDEVTIAEHDLERGTRMKIEEPNTPFRRMGSSDVSQDEDSQQDNRQPVTPEQLAKRLEEIQKLEKHGSEEAIETQKISSFEKKRKEHYNEFLALKMQKEACKDDESS